jgi:EAL domain-containing protein (putative c-di-GMP-specific phosphodiesterase class I)
MSGEPGGGSMTIEGMLERALENNELILHYQPILRTEDRQVEGAEALLRWLHPSRGLSPAGEFIRAIEQLPLIRTLDRWVLRSAVHCARQWPGGEGPEWVAVNLSLFSLRDHTLVGYLENLLQQVRLDPHHLAIEIAERAVLRDFKIVEEGLIALQQLGIRIAIDDFGSAGSMIEEIKRSPVDYLKLDGLFTHNLGLDPEAENRALTVIKFCHAAGKRVVATCVENQGQYDWLAAAGCDYLQGYHVGRPVPSSQLMVAVAGG